MILPNCICFLTFALYKAQLVGKCVYRDTEFKVQTHQVDVKAKIVSLLPKETHEF